MKNNFFYLQKCRTIQRVTNKYRIPQQPIFVTSKKFLLDFERNCLENEARQENYTQNFF